MAGSGRDKGIIERIFGLSTFTPYWVLGCPKNAQMLKNSIFCNAFCYFWKIIPNHANISKCTYNVVMDVHTWIYQHVSSDVSRNFKLLLFEWISKCFPNIFECRNISIIYCFDNKRKDYLTKEIDLFQCSCYPFHNYLLTNRISIYNIISDMWSTTYIYKYHHFCWPR